MKAFMIKDDVYWVGAIDWNPPNFELGLSKGTSYNSYLILDDKIALIDTVKHGFTQEIVSRIEDITPLSKVDYIILGSYKMDHTGCLPFLMRKAINATIVTTESSKIAIEKYHGNKWKYKLVKDGDTLDLGKRKISFSEFEMKNSDILLSYSFFDRILFSGDLFSQHKASSKRIDLGQEDIEKDAFAFFVNYLMPLDNLPDFSKMNIKIIAPNHGIIWSGHTSKILNDYENWIAPKPIRKILILYSSIWRGTEKMAYSIADGINSTGIDVKVVNLDNRDIINISSEAFSSNIILIGCPSFKKDIPLALSNLISYFNSIGIKNKQVGLFTCYDGKISPIMRLLELISTLHFQVIDESIEVQYSPNENEIRKCFEFGVRLGERTKNNKL